MTLGTYICTCTHIKMYPEDEIQKHPWLCRLQYWHCERKKNPAILFKDAVKYEWVKWLLMRTALN